MSRQPANSQDTNRLFPVFMKLEQLHLLVVGGGYVGFEKLNAILKNSPAARVTLVAREISADIRALTADHERVQLVEKVYESSDICDDIDLVIAAVNDPELSGQVQADAKVKRRLVNVADKPHLCDFYLGSVVQKGSVKIGISTNGKSPTVAKRLREVLEDMLPDEMEALLNNMTEIRRQLKGDFEQKVKQLNDLTSTLVSKPSQPDNGR